MYGRRVVRSLIARFFPALVALAAAGQASAAGWCLQFEPEGEVLVAFERGGAHEPTTLGSLWSFAAEPPVGEAGTGRLLEVRVPSPARIGGALLIDTSTGSITRSILESLTEELAVIDRELAEIYESSFVETAKGDAFDEGTFQAVVGATIQQMEDYADLVAEIAASVDAFADNTGDTDRSDLKEKYFAPDDDPFAPDPRITAASELIAFELTLRRANCND